ncbi:hypothetical protein, partial [Paenibacillus xylanexedens]|uniref:hypothetical protein n=1 Tax=Paenibacillus xylanexedens TaxID=528191 RepID=UPI001642DC16
VVEGNADEGEEIVDIFVGGGNEDMEEGFDVLDLRMGEVKVIDERCCVGIVGVCRCVNILLEKLVVEGIGGMVG